MKTTLDEYLGLQGLHFPVTDFMIDKCRLPHGQSLRQEKQMAKEVLKINREHSKKREVAIAEYKEKIASGEFIEKTIVERIIEAANGHPDNEKTQAARRRCDKKGIDWRVYAK